MGEALLRLSRGKNALLSSILGEVAVIIGRYVLNPFALAEDNFDSIEKTRYYFNTAKKGYEIERQHQAGLGFESLKPLNAIKEISLVSRDKENLDKFLDDIDYNLKAIEENSENLSKHDLIEIRDFFMRLSKELAKANLNPEAIRKL